MQIVHDSFRIMLRKSNMYRIKPIPRVSHAGDIKIQRFVEKGVVHYYFSVTRSNALSFSKSKT